MLTNLFIFLAFYSTDLNDNQRIDSDGMIERTYYLEQYRKDDQISFSEAFRAARKELGPGKIFMWNNRYFTTNFYYETVIVIADEVVNVNKEDKTYSSFFINSRTSMTFPDIAAAATMAGLIKRVLPFGEPCLPLKLRLLELALI